MAINKLFIHFQTKSAFNEQKENISDTSIVFIKETGEIYTHGKLYGSVSVASSTTNGLMPKEHYLIIDKESKNQFVTELSNNASTTADKVYIQYYSRYFGNDLNYNKMCNILSATQENAGVMSASDKAKLDNINVANSEYLLGTIEVLHSNNTFKLYCQRVKFSDNDDYLFYDIDIPVATNSACGLLSKEDKTILSNLSTTYTTKEELNNFSDAISLVLSDMRGRKFSTYLDDSATDYMDAVNTFFGFYKLDDPPKKNDIIEFNSSPIAAPFDAGSFEVISSEITNSNNQKQLSFVLCRTYKTTQKLYIKIKGRSTNNTDWALSDLEFSTNCPVYCVATSFDSSTNTFHNITSITLDEGPTLTIPLSKFRLKADDSVRYLNKYFSVIAGDSTIMEGYGIGINDSGLIITYIQGGLINDPEVPLSLIDDKNYIEIVSTSSSGITEYTSSEIETILNGIKF